MISLGLQGIAQSTVDELTAMLDTVREVRARLYGTSNVALPPLEHHGMGGLLGPILNTKTIADAIGEELSLIEKGI